MVKPSSVSGVVLDIDWEKMVDINLPLAFVSRKVEYDGKEVENRNEYYGEMMLIGDLHIGHRDHSGNPLNAHLHFLEEHPHIQIGLMGDYIEYSVNTAHVQEQTMDVDAQIDTFIKKFKPLKDRIAFMLWGNHEERYVKSTKSSHPGTALLGSLAREIGVSEHCYVAEPQRGVFCSIKAGDNIYGMYAQHGATGAISNDFYQQKRTAQSNNVSIIAQGHTHRLGWAPLTEKSMEVLGDNTTGMITRRRWLVSTGCFLKEPGYAEARSYPYTIVGAPVIRFYSSKEKIDFTELSQDYKDYITKGGINFGAEVGVEDWTGLRREEYEGSPTIEPLQSSSEVIKRITPCLDPR